MVKIKNKHRLKHKEIRILQDKIIETLDDTIDLTSSILEKGKINQFDLIFLDGIPCFFTYHTQLFFTMKGLVHFSPFKHFVTVDMGAIKFVTNGADVMAPGIVDADDTIAVNDAVWICDETHKKPLAVGIAVMSGNDMKKNQKGKAVILVHYVGDALWNIISSFS